MFRKSPVSVKGRWFITLIFVVTTLLPEIWLAVLSRTSPYGVDSSVSGVLRVAFGIPLYVFAMMGHGWARAIMAVLLILAGVILVGFLMTRFIPLGAVLLLVDLVCIVALIYWKELKPRRRKQFDY